MMYRGNIILLPRKSAAPFVSHAKRMVRLFLITSIFYLLFFL